VLLLLVAVLISAEQCSNRYMHVMKFIICMAKTSTSDNRFDD